MEPLMLADALYFVGGLAAFALIALFVPLAGRLWWASTSGWDCCLRRSCSPMGCWRWSARKSS